MSRKNFQVLVNGLTSNNIIERKRVCIELRNVLGNLRPLEFPDDESWRKLLYSLQLCLEKDIKERIEDPRNTPIVPKKFISDLFIDIINRTVAVVAQGIEIGLKEFLDWIFRCMNDPIIKLNYEKDFLFILEKILSSSRCRGKLKTEDWTKIYNLLRIIIEDSPDNVEASNCFKLVIRWGPTCGLSFIFLRDFDFMTRFCQKISKDSPRLLQENTLETIVNFCKHVAKDYRLLCCKFGEDVMHSMTLLYECKESSEKTKELLLEFFLLQMVLHHPNGVTHDDKIAYAYNWKHWRNLVKSLGTLLIKEVNGEKKLGEVFSKLFVEISQQLFMDPNMFLDKISSDKNRQSNKISLKYYIECIDPKNWVWVHLVSSIIKTYPSLIKLQDFVFLLQTLSSILLQILSLEMKRNHRDLIENIYLCLSIMLSTEKGLDTSSHLDEIKKIWKLIEVNSTSIIDNILMRHETNNMHLSLQTITTIDLCLQFFNLDNLQTKARIMRCILKSENTNEYKYLCHQETARLLVKLTLKKYIFEGACNSNVSEKYNYDCLKEIFLKISIEEDTLQKVNDESEDVVYISEADVGSLLAIIVKEFINNSNDVEEILFSKAIFLINISSYFTKYMKVSDEEIIHSQYMQLFKSILEKGDIKEFSLCNMKDEKDVIRLLECVDLVNLLFSLKIPNYLMDTLKGWIPTEFLQKLFILSRNLEVQENKQFLLLSTLKVAITKALVSFACIVGNNLNQNQALALEVLSEPNYNVSTEEGYSLVIIFLKTLKLTNPGTLPDSILENSLSCIFQLAVASYYEKEDILEILFGLYPHIAASINFKMRSMAVDFLIPFFKSVNDANPNVSMSLLKCLQVLCKLDPHNSFFRWSDIEIIKFIPEFLKNDYLEVKFKAVDVLVSYFEAKSKENEDIFRQKEVFGRVYEKSLAALRIPETITKIDEDICRKASVLHTYVSIATSCDNLTEECLYCLMKMAHILGKEQVNKVFNLIHKRKSVGSNSSTILKKHVVNLITRWLNDGHTFNAFDQKLFNCATKTEFFEKYYKECARLLLRNYRADKALGMLQKREKEIVEITATKIFLKTIIDVDNCNMDILTDNKILACYSKILGSAHLRKILRDHLDEIIIGLLDLLTDEQYILTHFGESVICLTKHLTVSEIESCFEFIEVFLCDDQPLALLLTDFHLPKLEKILLQLKLNLYEARNLENITFLHRYTFFVGLITQFLNPERSWRCFFIRDVIFTLLNVIDNNENCDSIVSAACSFLGNFLEKILPNMAQTFKDFLHHTVNSLKKCYYRRNVLASKCKTILEYLIIRNINEFREEIKTLNIFPDDNDFYNLRFMQKNVKYGNREPDLEDEIIQFLNTENLITKDDLVNLRKALAGQKDQLLEMYNRGYSENCENEVLKKLVCTLSQLSNSTTQKVSFEAARCLGELGPANLQTLVLQPEQVVINENNFPFEIIIGSIIHFLSKYITDCDINVIKLASKLLYMVLDYKEGRSIVDTGKNLGFGPINKNYIIPYFSSNFSTSFPNLFLDVDEKFFLSDDISWFPDENGDHNGWITKLVASLLKTFNGGLFHALGELCEMKVDISECLFPLLIHLLISLDIRRVNNLIEKKVDIFFDLHGKFDKKSIKYMLNVLNYITKKCNRSKPIKLHNELKIDYLKAAKAAEFCSNFFSAVYYSELWCQEVIKKPRKENLILFKRTSMIDYVYENLDFELGEMLYEILRKAYKSIGDIEALSGCGKYFLLHPKHRLELEKSLENGFIKCFSNDSKSVTASKELINHFKNCDIPMICSPPEDPDYECLWRLGQWSFKENSTPIKVEANFEDYFEQYRFFSLKALHDKNHRLFRKSLRSQFLCVINHLKEINLESCQSIYPVLTKLQCLIEMEDFFKCSSSEDVASLIEKWKYQDDLLIKTSHFTLAEPIIAQRLIMLTDYLNNHHELNDIRDSIVDLSLNFADWAREEDLHMEGLKIIKCLKRFSSLRENATIKIDFLDAQLSWSLNNNIVAMQIIDRICKNKNITPNLYSLALRLKGQYMVKTYSASKTAITSFLLDSVNFINSLEANEENIQNLLESCDTLALFAHKQYQQIKSYSFQKTTGNIEREKENEMDTFADNEIYHGNAGIKGTKESNKFLEIALKHYLISLVRNDDKNIRIFNLYSLLLENRRNQVVEKIMKEYLPKIPSYKFLIILSQIVSHLSEKDPDFFSRNVNEIVQKCAVEHPHHTLPLLLAMANTNRDQTFDKSDEKTTANDTRDLTAQHFIEILKKKGLDDFINELDAVFQSLTELAYYKSLVASTKGKINIPPSQKLMSVRNYLKVLVPTVELAVSVTENYSNIVGISSFQSYYEIATGTSKPKKVTCRGTNGKLYPLLLKCRHNLKQDAVIQQSFSIMNNLLSCEKSTKHLKLRTYKIVPLSRKSGIMKWIENSMPIGEYLTGTDVTPGAHQFYRPTDILPISCKTMFEKCGTRLFDIKLRVFENICRSFKPVFHHFFEEYFHHPAVWYEKRRAYIHSIATSSMCGYILGIGDRTTNNILIDKLTAEVIHVDFGVVFEQGIALPIPETVPFRLTRDIVDGMGVCGIEGVFKSSCEKTVEVFRQNSDTLLAVLKVFLNDPMCDYTLTLTEANKRQRSKDGTSSRSKDDYNKGPAQNYAGQAFQRVREKVNGLEFGSFRTVKQQVDNLIQQSVDPENLCKLFVDWEPYV